MRLISARSVVRIHLSPPSRKAVYVENQIGEKQIEHTKKFEEYESKLRTKDMRKNSQGSVKTLKGLDNNLTKTKVFSNKKGCTTIE